MWRALTKHGAGLGGDGSPLPMISILAAQAALHRGERDACQTGGCRFAERWSHCFSSAATVKALRFISLCGIIHLENNSNEQLMDKEGRAMFREDELEDLWDEADLNGDGKIDDKEQWSFFDLLEEEMDAADRRRSASARPSRRDNAKKRTGITGRRGFFSAIFL